MRLLGALVVGAIMYVAVPLLWERTILHQANEISTAQQIPAKAFVTIPEIDLQMNNWADAYNQTYQINTEAWERTRAEAQFDQSVQLSRQMEQDARRAQAGQDR